MHKAQLKLEFAKGFDERWNTLHHAKEMGVVENKCRSYKEALIALGWMAEGENLPDGAIDEVVGDPVVDEAREAAAELSQ